MRAIDCPSGHRLEGADDEDPFRLDREHVDTDHPEMQRTHPEMQRTDAELRARVVAALEAHDRDDAEKLPTAKIVGVTPLWEWAGNDTTVFSY
jgi:hypothetical protein